METSTSIVKADRLINLISALLILFWFFAAGLKLHNFSAFKGEINNQVFSRSISNVLVYTIPAAEIVIAGLLVYSSTRLAGMILSFSFMLTFTSYVGLALLKVYSRMPCNCAGLLGQNSTWEENFILNLFITAVSTIGLIITFKDKERRKKGMRNVLLHASLKA